MMKTLALLALILVFALALPAPATISLRVNGTDPGSHIDVWSGETIQVYSSDTSVWDGYVFIAPGGTGGVLGNPRKGPAGSGDNGGIQGPYYYTTSYGVGYSMQADYLALPTPEAGYQFLMDLTGDIADTGTINLHLGPSYSVVAQSFTYSIGIPEPATVALLALGALALLKKRKK